MKWLQQVCQLMPDNPEFRYGLGMLQLYHGDFAQGWKNYEYRLLCKNHQNTQLPIPRWQGQPLSSKQRLLVLAEQGYGDTFQFLRYLPLIQPKANNIVFLIPTFLEDLLTQIPGIDYCSAKDYQNIRADYYVELMSLPYLTEKPVAPLVDLFHLSRQQKPLTLPSNPSMKKNIGIVWSSSTTLEAIRRRSCPFEVITKLFDLKDIMFYGLQYDDDRQIEGVANFQNLSPMIRDFADTASIISQLDLVISVDTSVAHLSASLGKPVWLILPEVADWRWQHSRVDSPWYPSMRLFRQQQANDWAGVIESVAACLS